MPSHFSERAWQRCNYYVAREQWSGTDLDMSCNHHILNLAAVLLPSLQCTQEQLIVLLLVFNTSQLYKPASVSHSELGGDIPTCQVTEIWTAFWFLSNLSVSDLIIFHTAKFVYDALQYTLTCHVLTYSVVCPHINHSNQSWLFFNIFLHHRFTFECYYLFFSPQQHMISLCCLFTFITYTRSVSL